MPARHKQSAPTVVYARRLGVGLATVLVLGAGAGAPGSAPPAADLPAAAAEPSAWVDRPHLGLSAPADPQVSRSGDRQRIEELVPAQGRGAVGQASIELSSVWSTTDLNVWTGPGEDTRLLLVLDEDSRVGATGEIRGEWAQIAQGERLVWVRAAYLAQEKPEPVAPEPDDVEIRADAPSGDATGDAEVAPEDDPEAAPEDAPASSADAPCPDGSAVESGLVPNAVTVYRSVCAAFPEVSSWGGLRPGDDGFHGTGQAVDVMISDSAGGDAVAAYVLENASALGVSEILWAQQIWTAERSGEGWRPVEDRGSVTANHYDHVHVSVY